MRQVTPWFNLKKHGMPIRKGWYEVAYDGGMLQDTNLPRKYFDGKAWLHGPKMAKCAFGNIGVDHGREFWRGLMKRERKEGAA